MSKAKTKKINFARFAKQYGTPLNILDLEQLQNNIREYQNIIGSAEQIVFPMYAQPSLATLRELRDLGVSLLVTSFQDAMLAQLAGFNYKDLLYWTPTPEIKASDKMLAEGATIIVDSVEHLLELSKVTADRELAGKIFLRVAVDESGKVGNEQSIRYGLSKDEILLVMQKTKLPICGLQICRHYQNDME